MDGKDLYIKINFKLAIKMKCLMFIALITNVEIPKLFDKQTKNFESLKRHKSMAIQVGVVFCFHLELLLFQRMEMLKSSNPQAWKSLNIERHGHAFNL